MSISNIDSLIKLISSLSSSEKRHFSIYASRIDRKRTQSYTRLFRLIEKDPSITDERLSSLLNLKTRHQLNNLKRHLFDQILTSLSLLYPTKYEISGLHELMHHAWILKNKNLYSESLQYFNKAKEEDIQMDSLFEQHIEEHRFELSALINTDNIGSPVKRENMTGSQAFELKSLFRLIHESFEKNGFAKSERECYFKDQLLTLSHQHIDLNSEDALLVRSLQDYSNQNFLQAYKSSWAYIYKNTAFASDYNTMKAFEIMYSISYLFRNKRSLSKHKSALDEYVSKSQNSDHLTALYWHIIAKAELYNCLLSRNRSQFSNIKKMILDQYQSLPEGLHNNNAFHIYYLLAYCEACIGNYDGSLEIQNDLLLRQPQLYNSELGSYLRLLHIICHYRIGNFEYVENNLLSLRNNFQGKDIFHRHNEWMLQFLRRGTRALNFGLKDDINDLLNKMQQIRFNSFDTASYLLFDYQQWLLGIRNDTDLFTIK